MQCLKFTKNKNKTKQNQISTFKKVNLELEHGTREFSKDKALVTEKKEKNIQQL